MDKWGGAEILRRAVRGMLPKNRLRDVRLRRLRTFEGRQHPYRKNLLQYPGQDVKSLVKEPPNATQQEWLGEVKI